MKKGFLISFALLFINLLSAQNFITQFEKSLGKETATYFEAIQFYKDLDTQYTNIIIKTFNSTDAGYPLHLVLFSSDKKFDPKRWHEQGKVVVLINNGIHPGEPDGVDASMMLVRDLATGKVQAPANVVVGFIPMYNIGGSLNRNSYSRVNQEGPVSYGFRGNAQNLDLNRDFTKNDSKNARAFAGIFHFLNPDIFIDNHVSDGADYQHTMTMLTSQHSKLGGAIGKFLHDEFEPALYKSMEQKSWPMCPYVNFDESSPEKGWVAFYDPPRYSNGYAALFQTIGFTPETHMLKPFDERVKATYAFMQTVIEQGSLKAPFIKLHRKTSVVAIQKQTRFPLTWRVDTTQSELRKFKGYTSGTKTSEVSGLPRLFYDRTKPYERDIKFFNTFNGEKIVDAPKAYIIPQGWHAVIDILKLNGVAMQQIKSDTNMLVEAYRIEDYKSAARPYEKHHRNTDVVTSKNNQTIQFLKGDYIIYLNQRAKRYLVEMLEPTGDDSFFAWNFFDAILQQKEGYSDYRWEDVAAEYLSTHPELRQKIDELKKADPKFAASGREQLNFVYKNSPYYEPAHLRYPVYRLLQ